MIDARRVLALASAYDERKPDPVVAAAWQKAFATAGVEQELLEAAVEQHYVEEARRVMPADVIRRGRAIRAERAERRDPLAELEGSAPASEETRRRVLAQIRQLAEAKRIPGGAA